MTASDCSQRPWPCSSGSGTPRGERGGGAHGGPGDGPATPRGAAASARGRMGLHLPPWEQSVAAAANDTLEARLGKALFEDLTGRGAAMTLDEAGAFARG